MKGEARCQACRQIFPLDALSITAYGYDCEGCTRKAALDGGPKGDLDNVKVGRGRWWIMPIVIAAGGAFTFMFPEYVIVAIAVVAFVGMLAFRAHIRGLF
ncbi:MAG TPA: hypothetical protein VGM90_35475 [Kofleriaceae bacterium]|jgi:hypothetical protein